MPAAATPETPLAATSSPDTARVPVLVYHIVRPSYPADSKAVHTLAQTPEVFDAEMKYLADAGYRVISFGDSERHFSSGAPLPAKLVIISFDDGWSDQFAADGTISATAGACGVAGAGIQNLGPAGQLANSTTITIGTTTSSFNGLTVGETITGTASTLNWQPTLSGTLGISGGGTGLASLQGTPFV